LNHGRPARSPALKKKDQLVSGLVHRPEFQINRNEFTLNSEIHEIHTRQQGNFHLLLANLRKYQNGISCIGTKVYNNLPLYIKAVSKDLKKFEKKN
jgi:hypothetical protein